MPHKDLWNPFVNLVTPGMIASAHAQNQKLFAQMRQQHEQEQQKRDAQIKQTASVINFCDDKCIHREWFEQGKGWHCNCWIYSDCFKDVESVRDVYGEALEYFAWRLENVSCDKDTKAREQLIRMVKTFNEAYVENVKVYLEKKAPFFDGFMPDVAFNLRLWERLPKQITMEDVSKVAEGLRRDGLKQEKSCEMGL